MYYSHLNESCIANSLIEVEEDSRAGIWSPVRVDEEYTGDDGENTGDVGANDGEEELHVYCFAASQQTKPFV